jgi:N-acetylmuramic acid 6-phosphate etherase
LENKPLDLMKPEEIIGLMDEADGRAMDAVRAARKDIARAAEAAAKALGNGGRLIYVGAGTSGRLGVLDASECPPTFSSTPGQVVGIIAGGDAALRTAVEGAEDNTGAARAAVREIRVCDKDMVVGISASGGAPYVLAALDEAGKAGADLWLITCNTLPADTAKSIPSLLKTIVLVTGKEVIQGSTRLAAGTATKLVLNRLSTTAFVMRGKVYGELMVDVMPTNAKLVKRAVGIISSVAGCNDAEALEALKDSGYRTKVAALMKAKDIGANEADELLKVCDGSLRSALKRRD